MTESIFKHLDKRITSLVKKREASQELCGKLEQDLLSLEHDVENLDNTFVVFDHYLKNNYDQLKIFEETITAGLQDVFNDQFEFKFDIKKSGTSLACDFTIRTDKHDYYLDVFTQGNAVKEIIGTIVQLLVIKLKQSIPILILDEPYGGVRVHRQQRVARFLNDIAVEFGIQLIIISHSPEFCEIGDHNIDVET
jgi:DNA repair exonuclease SbcCD ATPase subunit